MSSRAQSFKLPIPLVEHSCWVVSHVVYGEPEPPEMTQARFDERRRETTFGGQAALDAVRKSLGALDAAAG